MSSYEWCLTFLHAWIYICGYALVLFTGPPTLTANITNSSSVVIQWDEVDDSLPTNYTVTWTSDGTNSSQSHTLIEQSSYTTTGLTLDTVYNITVTVSNRCGGGLEYSTSVSLSTDATSITSSITPTATASTNLVTTSTIAATTTISTQSSIATTTTTTTNTTTATTTIATATNTTITMTNAITATDIISTSNAMMSPSTVASNAMTSVITSGDADTTSIITTTSMISSTSSRDANTIIIIATTSSVSVTSTVNSADKTTADETGKLLTTRIYS